LPCHLKYDDCREKDRGEGHNSESGGKPNQSEELSFQEKKGCVM
jgi:hypothetical protein